jgi:glycosyltransferase involved in cell wall biosynthesis
LSDDEKKKIRLTFIGSVAPGHRAKIVKIEKIRSEFIDFLPYDGMIEEARSASLLFLPKLNSRYTKGLISAKLFDYLALMKPIVAIADLGSDIEDILTATRSGKVFLPGEARELRHHLSELISVWAAKGILSTEQHDELKRFSCRENVKKLAELFEEIKKDQ